MNMKHTPGPWTLNKQKNTCRTLWVGGNANAGGFQQEVVDVYTHHDKAEANARLIAAAPDMLESLHAVLLHLECFQAIEKSASRKFEIERIKSVIAKAEGDL